MIQTVYMYGNITVCTYTLHSYSDIYLHKKLLLTRPWGVLVSGGGEIGKGPNIYHA